MGQLFDETKLYLDFDALFQGFDDSHNLVLCLSERDISVILSALQPSLWASRWIDGGGNLLRDVARLPDLETGKTYAEQLIARVTMACDLTAQLADIALAIRQSSCCGVGDVGTIESGGSSYYGNQQPLDAPTTFGGANDEFATEAEYDSQRCHAANAIVEGFIVTLNNWALLSGGSLTILAISIGLAFAFLVAPPVALFVALGFLGFSLASFAAISNAIQANKADLVCYLYNSTSATDAYDTYHAAIRAIVIDLGFAEVTADALMEIFERLGAIDVMNTLYSAVALPQIDTPVDCSVCGGGCQGLVVWGSGDIVNGGTFNSAFSGVDHLIYFYLDTDRTITLSGLSGYTPRTSSYDSFRIWHQSTCGGQGTVSYSSDTFPAQPYCGAYVSIFSNTAFSVNVSIGSEC